MASSNCPRNLGLTASEGLGLGVSIGFIGAIIFFAIVFAAIRWGTVRSFISDVMKRNRRKDQDPPQGTSSVDEMTCLGELSHDPPPQPNLQAGFRHLLWRVEPYGIDCLETVINFGRGIDSHSHQTFLNTYWDKKNFPVSLYDENELVALAGDPVNGGTWSEGLSNWKSRFRTVSCFISQVIVKRMHPSCSLEESLLPAVVAACYDQVKQSERRDSRQTLSFPARPSRLIIEDSIQIWRETSFLTLAEKYGAGPPCPPVHFEPGDERQEQADSLTHRIWEALKYDLTQDQGPEVHARECLQEIVENASNAAFMLFAQGDEWEASWTSEKPGYILFPEIRLLRDGKVRIAAPARLN